MPPPKPGAGRPRRPSGLSAALLLAVQALYQRAVSDQSAADVLREFLQHRVEEVIEGLKHGAVNRDLLRELVEGVAREEDALDDMLAAVLDEEWTIERRSEEHTSELQSIMRISYAVFCLKKTQ